MEPKSVFTGVGLQPRTFSSPLLHSHRCQIFLTLTRRQTVISSSKKVGNGALEKDGVHINVTEKLHFLLG